MRRILTLILFALLTAVPAAAGDVPAGRLIFSSDRDGYVYLYQLDLATGEETLLVGDELNIYDAACSADGTQIALNGDGIDGIAILDLASGETRTLLGDRTLVNASFGWSPDGTQLIIAQANDTNTDFSLITATLDGETVTPIDLPNIDSPVSPAYSPDGTRIAFSAIARGVSSILVSQADGRDVLRLATGGVRADDPMWSPDGELIAYTAYEAGLTNLYAVDPEELTIRPLIDMGLREEWGAYMPVWSPDGAHVAFASMREGSPDLYLLSVDSGRITRLTDHRDGEWPHCWLPPQP